MANDKQYFRRAYPYFGRMFWPGDLLNPEILKPHITIMLKNSRAFLSESDLIDCIKSGAVKVPPQGEYYEKACQILGDQPKNFQIEPTLKELEVLEGSSGESGEVVEEVEENNSDNLNKYTREELESMKMDEVRGIGYLYNVKDNDKSELIDKILLEQDSE